MYSAFISAFARHSCFGSRFPFTSEYHSGCFSKHTFGGRISKKEWYALWRPLKKNRRWLPPSSGGMNVTPVSWLLRVTDVKLPFERTLKSGSNPSR